MDPNQQFKTLDGPGRLRTWRTSSRKQVMTILQLLMLALILGTTLYRVRGGHNFGKTLFNNVSEAPEEFAKGIKLRILPVGDSITAGAVSPDGTVGRSSEGNAWRLFLREILISEGVASQDIDFIGSKTDGKNNPDNQHEGWGNQKINSILNHLIASKSLDKHPNIILIHAGTNDMNVAPPDELPTDAHLRLGVLIDEIHCQVPEAVVVISKIIRNDWNQERTDVFNALLPQLVSDRVAQGRKVALADHSGVRAGHDKTHPSDTGYLEMAENWMDALLMIPSDWLQQPYRPGRTTQTCHRTDYNWREEIE